MALNDPSESARAPMPVLSIPVDRPRFCRTCGSAWQADWSACPRCTSVAAVVPLSVADEWRGMKSSLWLYFSLLAVCAMGIGLSRTFSQVPLELGLTAALSAVTIGWCLASASSIVPILRQRFNLLWLGTGVGFSFVTFAIAMGVIKGLQSMMKLPDDSMSKPFLHAGYSWAAIVLFVCVQPAVIEELAFRGVIFAGISRALSGMETVLVSALMFMTLHLSPARFPHTLALGIGAGFLRYRTKSIYPGMVMHFSHNFLCVLTEWVAR